MVTNMKNKLSFQFDSRIRGKGFKELENNLIDFVDKADSIDFSEYGDAYENSISDIEKELAISVSEIKHLEEYNMVAFYDASENVYHFYDIIYMRKFTFGLERLRA